jgi:hypothetical protein
MTWDRTRAHVAKILNLNKIIKLGYLIFEILEAVTMNITISCDLTPCCLVEVYRRFGRTSINFYKASRRYVSEGVLFLNYFTFS